MKILAIRGKNLASLAGEFAIDFQQPPLASAGLFAISGPTGAGKSTLLDTLCLALYDKTPRLQQATGQGIRLPDVGDETLPPQDVRNLLRRGCAEGYAEVEFIGNDQKQYRSRWSVRRARGKITGKLQASEMELTGLSDEQRIGGTKTEVLDAIHQKLGLSFDQFTRAVLLAQNEFSVFLKAPDDERATLLETLTGTDEYSRISIRAYDRAKRERQILDGLVDRLNQQQPLEPKARQALEAQKLALDQSLTEQALQKTTLEGHLQWYRQYQALQDLENAAQAQVAISQANHQQAQVRRDYLHKVASVQDARPLLTELDRLAGECQQARDKMRQAEAALATAQHAGQTAQRQQQQAQQKLEQTEQQRLQAAPDIALARALDAEINTLRPGHFQHQQTLAANGQKQQALEKELSGKQQEQQNAQDALAETQDWLQQQAHLEPLGTQWPRWESLLNQANTSLTQLDEVASQQASAEKRVQQGQHDMQTAQHRLDGIVTVLTAAKEAYQAATVAAAKFDANTLTTAHTCQQQRLEQLRQAESQWQALQHLQADQDTHNNKLQHISQRKQEQLALLADIRQALPALVASHEQAVKMLALLRLTCSDSVEKMRANLQAGDACPVCGAKDHPFASGHHPFRDQLAALEREVAACQQQRNHAEQQENRTQFEIGQIDQQCQELQTQLETLAKTIKQQTAQWQMLAIASELADCATTLVDAWFDEQIREAETGQNHILQSLKAMAAANNQRDTARQTVDSQLAQQTEAQQHRDAASATWREAQAQLSTASEKHQSLQLQLAHHLNELNAAFAPTDWQQSWRKAPKAYQQHCQQQAEDWQARQTQVQKRQHQIAILTTEITNLQAHLQQAVADTALAQAAFAAIDGILAHKQQRRAALFSGRAVNDIEAELETHLAEAKNRFHAATSQTQQWATKLATCREALAQTLALQESRQALLASSEQMFSAWLEHFNGTENAGQPLALAQLRQYLSHDNAWLTAERQALDAIKQALSEAQTILNERRQQCERHLQTRSSLESLENLQQQLHDLQAQFSALQNQRTELALQLRGDDERLKHCADLQATIAAQTAVSDTWSKLNQLIGSADGKRFRNIAQQLTLDILLGYANQHLKDLSRRYRLERVKETLALQVVDQDMGDEIRSVHSLSGGESFLLSLALALGLASLSSNRVRVESLFIDEGFGSLDADTLRVAMDALDSLQSLGRKVGVISHVQEMTERIGTRIQVGPINGGLSKVTVCG